ncbi:MAG: PIN domain-containing protein [Calditrichaeota bacterium]|nr:PIN domain-containing protein [Calditrichota bacterium]
MRLFLDESAWIAVLDRQHDQHEAFKRYFNEALQNGTKLFTSNVAVGLALSELKERIGLEKSLKFYEILEEAYLVNHIRILWVGRRAQKEALRWMRRYHELPLGLFDFAHAVLMDRRRIHTILTQKTAFTRIGFRTIPEGEGTAL